MVDIRHNYARFDMKYEYHLCFYIWVEQCDVILQSYNAFAS